MDREWLAQRLASGDSYEAIGRALDRHPSTVSSWARRAGLVSVHVPVHAARGGLERDALASLVDEGLSTREIAARVDRSQTTARHWLRVYGLGTRRRRRSTQEDRYEADGVCAVHGPTTFVRYGGTDHLRCLLCRRQRVSDRRRRVKSILLAEAGGCCQVCGYDRAPSALHFHHVDPTEKSIGPALRGVTRSLDRCRAEARKCVLLCANCHAEVESGLARLPFPDARQLPASRGESVAGSSRSGVAQLAERRAVNAKVVGSSPTPGARSRRPAERRHLDASHRGLELR